MGSKIDINIKTIINLYDELGSIHKVGERLSVSGNYISNRLREIGYRLSNRRHTYNEDYFEIIDSGEKAYWLGFFGADACIRDQKSGKYLQIKLSTLDIDHLNRFKTCINATTSIIKISKSETFDKNKKSCISNVCQLSIYGNKMVEDMKQKGIHSRKTFTIDRPNIDKKYYRDFIRGFFDGDGCCYIKEKSNNKFIIRYNISCASTKLRNFIKEELLNNGIEASDDGKLIIGINRKIDNYNFYNYLYVNSNIYLERKKNKGDEFIRLFKNKQSIKENFPGRHSYHKETFNIDRTWKQEEIDILYNSINKYPWSYLSGTLLPNKSKQQITRMVYKLKISHTNRRFHDEKSIKKYLIEIGS